MFWNYDEKTRRYYQDYNNDILKNFGDDTIIEIILDRSSIERIRERQNSEGGSY